MNALEAYKILLQRQMNEDRILGERTSLFLLATSFLFLAFVTLLNPDWTGTIFKVLRILVPLVGIFLTCVLYGMNRAATSASDFWHNAQRKIEENDPDFEYMRTNKITPHADADIYIWGITGTPKRWMRYPILFSGASQHYIPLTFFVLWAVSLGVAVAIVI